MKMIYRETGRTIAATMLSVLFLSLSSNSYAISPDPYADSFEDYSLYSTIIGVNGWEAGLNTNYATVTNGNCNVSQYGWIGHTGARPLESAAHTKVVRLDTETGAVTNFFSTPANGPIWIDMMVQPRQWSQDDPPSTSDGTIKAMFYFTTNGNLVTYSGVSLGVNAFTTNLSMSLASNEWVRLTVQMDYSELNGDFVDMFQVQLNGVAITNDIGWTTPLAEAQPGSWLYVVNAGTSLGKLNSVQFSGIGYLDDFVVTNSQVNFGGGTWTITVEYTPLWAGGSVSSPTGTYSVANNDSFYITNTPAAFWSNAYIVIDGIVQAPVGTSGWATVTGNHTYTNVFAPMMALSNTPHWWLSQNNLTNAIITTFDGAATNDADADGYPNWLEYFTSTDPNDPAKYFKLNQYRIDGTNYVEWFSDNIDPNLPPFALMRSTNLVTQPFTRIANIARVSTNTWMETGAPAGVPVFYRVAATNSTP